MLPTPAEVARTLASGRLCGRLSVTAFPDEVPVAHATTVDGDVLIAARQDSRAWFALRLNSSDEPAVLVVDDRPPFDDSPYLGRVHVGGWISRVERAHAQAAALQFVEVNPTDELLDVGRDVDLFHLELGEICLEYGHRAVRIEPEEFIAALPDPLHGDEQALLEDLREHHGAEIAALVPGAPDRIQPVRLDRHGLTVALPALARIEFPHPACCPGGVARFLGIHQTAGH